MCEFSLLVRSGVRVTNVARLLRGLLPLLAASAAATAAALPAAAAVLPVAPQAVTRADQWWLTALRVPAALRAAPEAGKGVTVAVLSTGVDAKHQDLAGTVTAGPRLQRDRTRARRVVLGRGGHGGRQPHRRARARFRRRRRHHRGRPRRPDPVASGDPGVRRPAELRRGGHAAPARCHRGGHQVRGRPWRHGHRPPARPGHAGSGPVRRSRRGRQRGRAGGGQLRARP